jgi:hypothetical protein
MIPMAMLSMSLRFDPLGEEAGRKQMLVSVFFALLCYLLMIDHRDCLMSLYPHVDMISPLDKDPVRADE